jgi:hypothetical protein
MKKIAILLTLIPTLLFATGSNPIKPTEPFLVIEINSNTIIDKLATDEDLCCIYEFLQSDSVSSNQVIIRDKKTGIKIGTIYGIPSKEFLKKISEQLTPEYIEDITRSRSY